METNTNQPDVTKLLSDNLNDLITWIKNSGEQVGKFAAEQTPLFIQEYLSWMFWSNLTTLIIIGFFLILSAVTVIISLRSIPNNHDWEHDFHAGIIGVIIGALIGLATFMVFLITGIPAIQEVVKVKTAPRVVLVEKIRELTR